MTDIGPPIKVGAPKDPNTTSTADISHSSESLRIPELPPDVDALAAALAYGDAGWYVVPVKRGSKNPGSVVGEHWQRKSSRDPQQIVAWFAGTDYGIALHCGRSGALVIDVDDPDFLPDVLRRNLDAAPYQSTRPDTPGRGHHVFAMPPGRTLGNSTGELGSTWGDVRGVSGVIIVEPTPHKDGGEYRWQRVGTVRPLPAEIGDALPDGSSAEDAASDATVAAFLTEHVGNERPGVRQGLLNQLRARFDAGESRHPSTVPTLVGAMKEARLGLYPALPAAQTIWEMFRDAVGKQPTSGKQGPPRTGTAARAEFKGLLA